MNNFVQVGGLVHEVICEHVRSFGAAGEKTEVMLDLVCGDYVTVPRDFDWRHHDPFPTCFHCISGSMCEIDPATLMAFTVDTKILDELEKKYRT